MDDAGEGNSSSLLLSEILSRRHRQELSNTLLVNVYLLSSLDLDHNDDSTTENPSNWLSLAALAVQLNKYLQSSRDERPYPWIQGGDGPVFGVHIDEHGRLPHLRAECRYDANVGDAWALIRLMVDFSHQEGPDVVVECWDVDDGHIILVETAPVLPAWVDEPAQMRHRCWIQEGRVVLIAPSTTSSAATSTGTFTRRQALKLLVHNHRSPTAHGLCQRLPSIDDMLRQRLESTNHQDMTHTAAVALPVPVAHLLQKRPEVLPLMVSAWAQSVINRKSLPPASTFSSSPQLWQWTVQVYPRLSYAQCRTLTAPSGEWDTTDAIPSRYATGASLRRIQRQCCNAAAPHLQHGVALGARLIAGLEWLIAEHSSAGRTKDIHAQLFTTEREERVLNYWSRLVPSSDWLGVAWAAGPRHAQHSLEYIVDTPVYYPEVKNRSYPLKFPGKMLTQVLLDTLRSCVDDRVCGPHGDAPPQWHHVSTDEKWLDAELPDPTALANATERDFAQSDEMQQVVDGFRSFLKTESEVEGVMHTLPTQDKRVVSDRQSIIQERVASHVQLRSAAVLHLLRETLAAPDATHLRNYLAKSAHAHEDLYFSKEDYTLMEPEEISDNSDNDQSDGENTNTPTESNMVALMEQMDLELRQKEQLSRSLDTPALEVPPENRGVTFDDTEVARDAHLLSNLMESVDASAGAAGPVRNILAGMGKDVPKKWAKPK